MNSKENTESRNSLETPQGATVSIQDRLSLMRGLHHLPGNRVLHRIMEDDHAQTLIPQLPSEDFFWLVKKVGDPECLPLLRLASEEQWQYLLDLEIWQRDRLDISQASEWIKRLQEADPGRLTRWLFQDEQSLAYYYLFQNIEVVITYSREEIEDLPEGFFSVDGIFHIRAVDPHQRDTVENLIRIMASGDYEHYQALILGLAGVLPSELEEQMLRLRNVRLAEHGFLPFEEAISVYAPLSPDTLRKNAPDAGVVLSKFGDAVPPAPLSPLDHAGVQSTLTEVIAEISDPALLDKLRIEFAGLCNQILAADSLRVHDLDVLVTTCRRAAGYLNLALERLSGDDLLHARQILKETPLLSLFRVGFGLALKMKWQAERWVKKSWFASQGLGFQFWGAHWGGILSGILQKKPRFYAGFREAEEYRDFHGLAELGESLDVLRRLMVLDGLMDRITEVHPLSKNQTKSAEFTYRTLLFNFWARNTLELEPTFQGITLAQGKGLLRQLRGGKNKPPYPMAGIGERFCKDIMRYASDADQEAGSVLRDTLSLIWKQFQEEYQWIPLEKISRRHARFFSITPSSEAAPR